MNEIVSSGGLKLLVEFLYVEQPDPIRLKGAALSMEQAACERMHQKVAIALTRLSKNQGNAHELLKLKGIVSIKMRHSDCLAILKELSENNPPREITIHVVPSKYTFSRFL